MAEAAYAADFHQAMEEMVPEFGSRALDTQGFAVSHRMGHRMGYLCCTFA